MTTTPGNQKLSSVHPFLVACASSCKKTAGRLQRIRNGLLREFRSRLLNQDRMLQLALNEAEALAHDTGFPVLTFPTLAREKVEAVAAWDQEQKRVRRDWYRTLAA